MSHFTVTALTRTDDEDELNALLAPYDENLEVEEYTDEDGNTYMRNPNAKWDWWTVGGRWDGELMTTEGKMVNSARKGDLAIGVMRATALAEAEAQWEQMDIACRDLPVATTWDELRVEHNDDWSKMREIFHAQPRVRAMKSVSEWRAGDLMEDYQAGRDLYIERETLVRPAFIGFGAVGPEGWIERGRMGWFAASDDTTESSIVYGRTLNALIDALPDDAWITMLDCHI